MSISIAFCFNDAFSLPAGVSMYSLLKNARKEAFFDIYVLYLDSRLSEENITKIMQLEKVFSNCKMSFINIGEVWDEFYEIYNFSIDIYIRLFIPKILKHIDKVIYLDSDTIILDDIQQLYHFDMDNYCIAAAKDVLGLTNSNFRKYLWKNKLNSNEYFNSGVLVLNVKKIIREYDILKRVKVLLNMKYKYPDQDILNKIFETDVVFFRESYNYTSLHNKPIESPKIIHYVKNKPWNSPCAYSDLWWQYYRESPFYVERFYYDQMQKVYWEIDRHLIVGKFLKKIGFYKMIIWIKKFL